MDESGQALVHQVEVPKTGMVRGGSTLLILLLLEDRLAVFGDLDEKKGNVI